VTENSVYNDLLQDKQTTTTNGKYSEVQGFPKIFYFGVGKPLWNKMQYHILVMENLGPDLYQIFYNRKKPFSIKTVLMLASQFLSRIEFLHEEGYIHRDIKPDNFLTGIGKNKYIVYLADFGLAKRNKEIYNERAGFEGTPHYASLNTHLGISQSRRDDMESIGYVLMELLSGSQPWDKRNPKTKKQLSTWEIGNMKKQTSIENMCKGCYKEFHMYLHYCRGLRFDEKPDYDYLEKLFNGLFFRLGYTYDWRFDWIKV
jgi:serine/threonine protein kinase